MAHFTIIDSHAHLQFPAYDADRDAVCARAREVAVGMVNVGTEHTTSRDAITLAETIGEGAWASVGFHPGHLDADPHHDVHEQRESRAETFLAEAFQILAEHARVVAVGECGLDYYRLRHADADTAKKQQREVFRQQITIARTVKKPLIIHCRQAFGDLVSILKDERLSITPNGNGVIHFFSGTADDAKTLVDLGFFLGFGGVITFARDYDEALRATPLDRILLETDAPYVAPVPYRGKRNEPAFIVETARKIADIRGIGYDEVADASTRNATVLFGL